MASNFPSTRKATGDYLTAEEWDGLVDHVRGWVSARSWGVVGDGTTDDTDAFADAVADAKAKRLALDIRGLKILLDSQATPINTDGLVLLGSGHARWDDAPVDWPLQGGDGATWAATWTAMQAVSGSAIASRYNGPIFTGKKFSGSDFTVMGDSSQANSSCFVQTTPTEYPGWAAALHKLARFSAFYFGSHGIELKGGLELAQLYDLHIRHCSGVCLYIHQTNGINSPVQYFSIRDSQFMDGLLGNIVIEGFDLDAQFDRVCLNSPGQLARRSESSEITNVTEYADIDWGLRLVPALGTVVAQNVTIRNVYAEWCQGLVLFDAADGRFWKSCCVEGTYLNPRFIPAVDTGAVFASIGFNERVMDLRTIHNESKAGTGIYFAPGKGAASGGLDIMERFTSNGYVFLGDAPTAWQIASYGYIVDADGNILPPADNEKHLGWPSGSTWYAGHFGTYVTVGGLHIGQGTADPAGSWAAPLGSLYLRTGSTSPGLYVKETEVTPNDTTGWVKK